VVALLLALAHLRVHALVVAVWAMAIGAWCGRREGRLARGLGALAIAVLLPAALGLGPLGIDFILRHAGELDDVRRNNAVGALTALRGLDFGEGLWANLRHLPIGLSAVLLEPYPWRPAPSPQLRLASLEMLLWYPLLALAVAGSWRAVRTRSPLVFAAAILWGFALMYALTEGNLGTTIRHRGDFVWAMALLAAQGAAMLAARHERAGVTRA
jgi:hypothetical protein